MLYGFTSIKITDLFLLCDTFLHSINSLTIPVMTSSAAVMQRVRRNMVPWEMGKCRYSFVRKDAVEDEQFFQDIQDRQLKLSKLIMYGHHHHIWWWSKFSGWDVSLMLTNLYFSLNVTSKRIPSNYRKATTITAFAYDARLDAT